MPPNHRSTAPPQLQTFKGKRCKVRLQNELIVEGMLSDWDQFMNITILDCHDSQNHSYKSAVLRGNAVVTI